VKTGVDRYEEIGKREAEKKQKRSEGKPIEKKGGVINAEE